MKKLLFFVFVFAFLLANLSFVFAQKKIEIDFFYGKGCPHCARADKFLKELKEKYPSLEIKKYEVYFHPENVELFKKICSDYGIEPKGVPTIFIKDKYFIGFGEKTGKEIESYLRVLFEGKVLDNKRESFKTSSRFTFAKILSLAVVDSVNPCAFAVLTLMLIAILTYNPHQKKRILFAGFSFVASVFLMYLIYGLIIIRFFQIVQALANVRIYLYNALGGLAVLLGLLNIKDFIKYKPGGFLTEMPMFLRPKVKKIISGVISPKGAFLVGIFVTLFLLPCTIGPYIIAGGILSALEILKSLPYLLVYNFVFVLPMLAITLLVYLGLSKIEDISGWKERNIKYLHLTAGIIILALGIAIILGIV